MRKKLSFLILFLLFSGFLFAQTPAHISLKGTVCDSAGLSVPSAMVMLLNSKDSTLLNYTQVDEKGGFEFKSLKNSGYLIKISHMSFLPYQKNYDVSTSTVFDIGTIKLKLISKQLMEVVIKAARAPLKFRGDTIEYDAASFKVPPGSTVEDLLRRLPGIEVDLNGNIKAQGKSIRRLYVEGKSFFGDDPKMATKNLDADAISNIQVFDEKSEQSKLTGIDDGVKTNKSMNLTLKEEYKKGAFGKLTAAHGDQGRWVGSGNYNRFNKTQQLSFIGFGNNISQTGVNGEDYTDFKGQNSFDSSDNGDFGFRTESNRLYFSSGDDLMSWGGSNGFSKNYGGGTNYNFDNTKTKLNFSYVYKETSASSSGTSDQETFLQNSSYKSADTSSGSSFRGNHLLNFRLEQNIDSADLLFVKAKITFIKSIYNNASTSLYSDAENIPTRYMQNLDIDKSDSWSMTSAVIFRHRFKKKGANFAWSAGFNTMKTDGLNMPTTYNKFFQANTFTEQSILLTHNFNSSLTQFKSGMLLTEPLSKKIYWEAFYNFSSSQNRNDRMVHNRAMIPANIIDSLTAFNTDDIVYNRIGTSFRYSGKGLNATIGLAGEQKQIKGGYSGSSDLPVANNLIKRTYSNWIPNLNISYQIFKTTYLSGDYKFETTEPSTSQLITAPVVENLLYKYEANPDLHPEKSHNFSLNASYWNQGSSISGSMSLAYSKNVNHIVYNQTVTTVDKVGILTVSKPGNVNGSETYSLYSFFGFPLIKSKLKMDVNFNINFSNSPTFINDVENVTRNRDYRIGSSFSITPYPKLIFEIRGSINFNNITYSFSEEQNQKIRNYTTSYSAKWQFLTKSYFESNFDYSVYKNDRYGFNQNIPMLNASFRQIIGKENRIELKASAFDIFNRNLSISQNGDGNSVYRSKGNTLARYFMISFSYNIRGFDVKSKSTGAVIFVN